MRDDRWVGSLIFSSPIVDTKSRVRPKSYSFATYGLQVSHSHCFADLGTFHPITAVIMHTSGPALVPPLVFSTPSIVTRYDLGPSLLSSEYRLPSLSS